MLAVGMGLYAVLLLAYISKGKQRSQGLRWLQRDLEVKKKRQHWMTWLANLVRSAFSTTEYEMQNKFLAAGFYNTKYAVFYMPFKFFILLAGIALFYWVSVEQSWTNKNLGIAAITWLVFTIIAPDAYLAARTKALRISISNKLPYLIDLLAVCVQTGMTIEAAMTYLSREMKSFDKDLGFLLTKTNDRTQIVGLEVALKELYERVPTNEMRSFIMTLNQSLQYGTSIYDVLTTLSFEIREVQMLGLEEKIGKLAAKMSIPLILFIMIPVVILIAAPGVMRMLYD